jgi:hypothetical protein
LTRLGLDFLAAFIFLVRGSFQDAKAVVKGHIGFHKMKSESLKSSEHNHVDFLGSRNSRKSILWDYYIRGKKTYSDL